MNYTEHNEINCLSYFPVLVKLFLVSFLMLSSAFIVNAEEPANKQKQTSSQPTKEWVVVLSDPRPARLQGWSGRGYSGSDYNGALELKRIGVKFAKKNGLKLKQEWFIESLSVYCLIVEFTQNQEKTLQALKNNKLVEWVQESNDFELLSKRINTLENSNIGQLNERLDQPKQEEFQRLSYDGQGIVIAMIDSGIDNNHRDLLPAIKGVADFVISNSQKRQNKVEVHGTAVAGVLIAQPNESVGISGVAPAAKLLAFRGCWEEENNITNCNTLSLARALDAVVKNQPDILNLSLSGPYDQLLNRLIDKIVKNKTAIVAAYDPKRSNSKRFPLAQDGVLIVRAENIDKQSQQEFTAPGAKIVTKPYDAYTYVTGHSIASAHTSGLLALLTQARVQNPKLQSVIDMAISGKLKSAQTMVDSLKN